MAGRASSQRDPGCRARWVREIWARETGLGLFEAAELDAAYERVLGRLRVAPTPMAVMGRRNLLVRDALRTAGMPGKPLPRAVVDCEGCSDCLTGCAGGKKQSMDRTFLGDARGDGAEILLRRGRTRARRRPACCRRERLTWWIRVLETPEAFTVRARRAVVLGAGGRIRR